ncbi:hypothetical protein I317_07692 [Kwoniella heveanensis CBS 569]|nr:hypothetical protein I317_07692 [Kwoniella heveanensis CBS 569]
MIATPSTASIDLLETASPLAIQAAKHASSNQHALINLIRLVKSLETKYITEDDELGEEYLVKRDWETVLYARALLDALKEGNEQSSKTTSTLADLERTLDNVQSSFRARVTSPLPTPSLNPALIALPMTPNPSNPASTGRNFDETSTSRTGTPTLSAPSTLAPTQRGSTSTGAGATRSSANTPVPTHNTVIAADRAPTVNGTSKCIGVGVRKRRTKVDDYLLQRSRADLQDSSSSSSSANDLLPLKPVVKANRAGQGLSDRDALLAGAGKGVGSVIGSAQLHEELGGQLADMSHRLKLNAVHFSNSLEKEKGILETSQEVLEKNLASTRSSKKQLSSVSKKGRGTTCLTLGVVVLVMVLFIWTYMLIRFT